LRDAWDILETSFEVTWVNNRQGGCSGAMFVSWVDTQIARTAPICGFFLNEKNDNQPSIPPFLNGTMRF
jgi:hypothetical protein